MQTEYFRLTGSDDQNFETINTHMLRYVEDPTARDTLIEAYYRLIDSGALTALLRNMITKIRDDHEFSPIWISSTEFPVIAHANSVLSYRCFAPENEINSIYASPGTIILSVLSSRNVDIEIYHGKEETETQSLLRRVTVGPNGSVEIGVGQSFRIFSNGEPALLCRLLLDLGEHTPVYDANTLEYLSMVSLSPTSSRWYFMARVAGQLATGDAMPILRRLVEHPNYHVRWTALQEMFSHDVPEAIAMLNRFKTDTNRYISEQACEEAARIEQLLAAA